jgi:hypothetical protein
MGRVKGTPKTGGRKAGTPNKITGTLKEFLSDLIDDNREQIKQDLESLSAKDRLQMIERFMQYIMPKQKEIEFSGTMTEDEKYNLEDLPEDLLFEIADKIQDAHAKKLLNK